MPKNLTITAYLYDELTDQPRKKAREWMRDSNREVGYTAELSEDFKSTTKECGLGDFRVWYTLNHCQGDGVAFEGNVDIDAFVKAQDAIAWEIAHNKVRIIDQCDPQHLDPTVKVGVKAIGGIAFHEDPVNGHACVQGNPTKYAAHITVRCEEQHGREVVRISTLPSGKIEVEMHEPMSEGYLERLKEMAIPSDTLAALKMLIERDVDFAVTIKHHGRYYHWNSMNIEVEIHSHGPAVESEEDRAAAMAAEEEIDAFANTVEGGFQEYVESLSRLLEKDGYAQIEDRDSDAAVEEDIRANGYLFTPAGRRCYTLPSADEVDEKPEPAAVI